MYCSKMIRDELYEGIISLLLETNKGTISHSRKMP